MTYSKINKKLKEEKRSFIFRHFEFKFILKKPILNSFFLGVLKRPPIKVSLGHSRHWGCQHQWHEAPKDSSWISICRVLAIFILKGQFSNKTKHPLLCNPCLDLGFCTLWKWHGNPCRSTVTILHLQLSFWLVGTTKDLSARPY